jgi:hypothetical protein
MFGGGNWNNTLTFNLYTAPTPPAPGSYTTKGV